MWRGTNRACPARIPAEFGTNIILKFIPHVYNASNGKPIIEEVKQELKIYAETSGIAFDNVTRKIEMD